jgi:uncharacterized membrane protein YeaQ/YmgE (transglycosylase-associated protein family)
MWSSFAYHEPSTSATLILLAFLYLLNLAGWFVQLTIGAGLLGQIFIGIVFGTPLAGWLPDSWEDAFVAVGYVGLLVLVFEGEAFPCLSCHYRRPLLPPCSSSDPRRDAVLH